MTCRVYEITTHKAQKHTGSNMTGFLQLQKISVTN